eukprot:980561-Prorocentrum_minimum.AAC.1
MSLTFCSSGSTVCMAPPRQLAASSANARASACAAQASRQLAPADWASYQVSASDWTTHSSMGSASGASKLTGSPSTHTWSH